MDMLGLALPPSSSQAYGAGAAQIRSRITVVCAECKRLKLKCDRRVPCGSCVKRDTVNRCAYSAAAAEKIDVQSLHNRVLLLEAQVQTLSGGSLRLATQPTLDRAPVVINGGSSVIVNLEDIASVWLEQLDLKDFHYTIVNETDSLSKSFFDTNTFPDLALFRSPDYDRPTVTPALLDRLPPENMRDALMEQFLGIMVLRPSFNFPEFRRRVQNLFAPTHRSSPPTLSFFACAALGFALGAHAWLETNKSSAIPHPAAYDPDELFALADHAIQIHERVEAAHDVDYITALILQVLFLIHDGKPRVNPRVSAIVGKVVVAARDMGLGIDPDETAGRYSVFEAEMRRRCWWDVYYYDLFISDFLGHVPLIADSSFTTNMPQECDDDCFTPSSSVIPLPASTTSAGGTAYFLVKCKLAQLVKNMKKRILVDPKQPTLEPSLELAQTCESEINQWLAELDPAYRLDLDHDGAPTVPEYLVAQRSEIAMIANSLMLKIFHPFIKKSYTRPSHHAMYASVGAAHKVVTAAERLQATMKGPKHSLAFMSYFFNVQLFHAAIICAHSYIQEPQSVYAKECMKNLNDAIRIMYDPVVPTSRGPMRGGVEGSLSEPLRVLELMKHKAEESARGTSFHAGVKRKHAEVEDHLEPGFHIPFAGPAIVTSDTMLQALSPQVTGSGSTQSGGTTKPRPVAGSVERSMSHAPTPAPLIPTTPVIPPSHNGWVTPEAPSSPSSLRVATSTRDRAKTHSQYPQLVVRNRDRRGSSSNGSTGGRRNSVSNSNRPSGPTSASPGTSAPKRSTPPTLQTTLSYASSHSGPPSASPSGMHTSMDSAADFGPPQPLQTEEPQYFIQPMSAAPPPPVAAPTPTYANPPQPHQPHQPHQPQGMVYAQPSVPSSAYTGQPPNSYYTTVQYHPGTSQAMYESTAMYAQMDTAPSQPQPQHHPPPPQPMASHYAPSSSGEGDNPDHETSDAVYRVQTVWPTGANSRYSTWSQEQQQPYQ